MSVHPGHQRARRARDFDPARGPRRERRGSGVRARRDGCAHRAARVRPSRREADARPHDAGRAARGDGRAAAATRLALKLAVAATAPFGADVLERLEQRHDVTALLTRPDAPRGRGRKTAAPPAKETATRLGIPVLQPARPEPGLDLGAETVVVAAYGLLIPEAVLDERLWLNVHPSLLPRWRGAAPVERAIMAGDSETGVTIHRTIKELDAGPIAAQRAFPIGEHDDAGAVYEKAARVAVELLDGVLPQPEFSPQGEDGLTCAEKITAADQELDWDAPPDELLNRIRALSPHIGARAQLHGRPVTIWKARVAGGRLEPIEVQPDGKRRMTYDEFVRGLR